MAIKYKTSLLINNYNYAQYIEEALKSVYAQTVPFDEVIIVDDGSTDSSLEVIENCARDKHNTIVIPKKNEGQVSCINEGFKRSTGDLIYFLDSDDIFTEKYLEITLDFHTKNSDCDYLFTAVSEFGNIDGKRIHYSNYCQQTGKIGISLLRTLYGKELIGVPTSTISVKRQVLEKFLPIDNYSEWKICADDCLAYGSSLAGAIKYVLDEPLVRYRVHHKNNWAGQNFSKQDAYQKKLIANRQISYFCSQMSLGGDLGNLVMAEIKSLPNFNYELMRFYLRIINNSKMYQRKRSKAQSKIVKMYFKQAIKRFSQKK